MSCVALCKLRILCHVSNSAARSRSWASVLFPSPFFTPCTSWSQISRRRVSIFKFLFFIKAVHPQLKDATGFSSLGIITSHPHTC